jgi:hypothetical protein
MKEVNWIRVCARLPTKDGMYLVFQGHDRWVREFKGGGFMNTKADKYGVITHWMSLPEPPRWVTDV